MPTPDPSASLTAWQSYVVARDQWVGDTVSTAFVVFLIGLGFVTFLLGSIAVTTAFRRR